MYFLDHNQVTWSRRNSLSLPLSLSETFCKSAWDKTLPDHRCSLLLIWPEYIQMFWAGVWRKASNFWIIVVLVTDEHIFLQIKTDKNFLVKQFWNDGKFEDRVGTVWEKAFHSWGVPHQLSKMSLFSLLPEHPLLNNPDER